MLNSAASLLSNVSTSFCVHNSTVKNASSMLCLHELSDFADFSNCSSDVETFFSASPTCNASCAVSIKDYAAKMGCCFGFFAELQEAMDPNFRQFVNYRGVAAACGVRSVPEACESFGNVTMNISTKVSGTCAWLNSNATNKDVLLGAVASRLGVPTSVIRSFILTNAAGLPCETVAPFSHRHRHAHTLQNDESGLVANFTVLAMDEQAAQRIVSTTAGNGTMLLQGVHIASAELSSAKRNAELVVKAPTARPQEPQVPVEPETPAPTTEVPTPEPTTVMPTETPTPEPVTETPVPTIEESPAPTVVMTVEPTPNVFDTMMPMPSTEPPTTEPATETPEPTTEVPTPEPTTEVPTEMPTETPVPSTEPPVIVTEPVTEPMTEPPVIETPVPTTEAPVVETPVPTVAETPIPTVAEAPTEPMTPAPTTPEPTFTPPPTPEIPLKTDAPRINVTLPMRASATTTSTAVLLTLAALVLAVLF
jgi:hypothetical protein